MGRLMRQSLHRAGQAWEKEQTQRAAEGGQRTYRVLDAAEQQDINAYYMGMARLLLRCPAAVPPAQRTLTVRAILSRMISRSVCSIHQLLRVRRQGNPYKLFLAMGLADWPDEPSCLRDELTTSVRGWYPRLSAECKAVLESIALAIDLDISAIESRHALSRRLALVRGTQTWAPSMATTAAEWTLRQVSAQSVSTPKMYQPENETPQPDKPQKKEGKRPGCRGGGGGAYRAFLHVNHAGKQLSSSSIRELTAQYHQLSPADRAYYESLGRRGNAAWRFGHAAFGGRVRRSSAEPELADAAPPGAEQAGGAMVQADADESVAQMPLVPFATRDFKKDLQDIRKKFQAEQQKQKEELAKRDKTLADHQDAVCSQTPDVFEGIPASQVYGSAHAGQRHPHVKWFPPCQAFAQARRATLL